MKARARIYYAARRLKSRAPHAKLLFGIWSKDEGDTLNSLKHAVDADYAAGTFGQAVSIIVQEATEQKHDGATDPVDQVSSFILNR